jgi:putative DNA primase/helicase
MNTQQIQEALARVWIWDLAELGGLQHAETEKSKAIISRRDDIGRGAYERRVKRQRRHSVLTMTTNLDCYLQDSTGNRRFWIVRVGNIDLKALLRDRDQLLAEAIALEATAKSLVLPKKLWPEAAATQTQSMEDDPWLDPLSALAGTVIKDEERISNAQIFKRLEIPRERQTRAVLRRIVECMRRLGWIRADKPFKLDGSVVRGFVRPAR